MDGVVIEPVPFAPNHLSSGRLERLPATSAASAVVRTVLAEGWGLVASQVSQLGSHSSGSGNWIVDNRYVLKSRRDAAAFERELELTLRAGKAGVPVALPIARASGEHILRHASNSYSVAPFLDGSHFTAEPGQFAAAAHAFVALGEALGTTQVRANAFAGVETIDGYLSRLPHGEAALLLKERSSALLDAIQRSSCDSRIATVHTDFHPMNVLFRELEVLAILDFEDVAHAPWAVAAGFGLFKLAREALSRTAPGDRVRVARELVATWNGVDSTPAMVLAAGARRRTLANILEILTAWIDHGDTSMNYGLPGHLLALEEINFVFEDSHG